MVCSNLSLRLRILKLISHGTGNAVDFGLCC